MHNDDRRCTGDDAKMGNEGFKMDDLRVMKLTIIVNVRTNSALKPLLPDTCFKVLSSIKRAAPGTLNHRTLRLESHRPPNCFL